MYVQILKVSNLKLKLNIKQKNILQLRIMISKLFIENGQTIFHSRILIVSVNVMSL